MQSASIIKNETSRGFTTLTGQKNGKRVTILSIGMGFPMADFFLREVRHVTQGPLDVIRLGSCGTPHTETLVKTVVVAKNSFAITTNYDAFEERKTDNDIHVAACAIVLAERKTGVFLPKAEKHEIEKQVGDVCLTLLAQRV